MPRSIERPSGQTEWSRKRDRVVGPSGYTVACGGSWFNRSSDQQCQARHPQELKPKWAVFFVGMWYVASLVWLFGLWSRYEYLVVPTWWFLGRGWWSWLQAEWAWAMDVALRRQLPSSFSWSRFPCVFSRIFLAGGSLLSFSGVGAYFWTPALFANFAADSWSSPRTPYFPAFDAYTKKKILVASAQISSQRQLMGCHGSAGLGSGVPQHFGICRPSETKLDTLLRAHCRVGSLLSSLFKYLDTHVYLNQV